jgi:hypothetical protein
MTESAVPKGPKNLKCPDWQKPMSQVCHTCPLWMSIEKERPDGSKLDDWNCAKVHSVMMSIDVIRATRGSQAAAESLRNAIVMRADLKAAGLTHDEARKMLTVDGTH